MIPKMDIALNDFSGGELNSDAKRMDKVALTGARIMTNMRILNSRKMKNRPGRRALYPVTNGGVRTERFTISAGNTFDIQFASGHVKIINSAGSTVANFTTQGGGAALPWASTADIQSIVYTIIKLSIYITFAGMRPQVISFDGVSTWGIADYAETVAASGQKRTPFYRLSPQSVTLQPSATAGNITVTFGSAIAVAGMVGTRLRYCGRQLLLTALLSATSMSATVIEPLPPAQTLTVSGAIGTLAIGDVVEGATSGAIAIATATASSQQLKGPNAYLNFQVGDTITGGTSGATGVVTSMSGVVTMTVSLNTGTVFVVGEVVTGPHGSTNLTTAGPTSITMQLTQTSAGVFGAFVVTEKIAGPTYSATVSTVATTTPQAVSVWDDEVINAYRGYPASCFNDQFRVGFCNFPAIPGGIAWSAINAPNDLYVGANPSDAMFEIAPGKTQVLYVVPGAEGSEFVFCDNRVYYIPISVSNPLKPGSVAFNTISGDGCYPVQPKRAGTTALFIAAGGKRVSAIIAIGATNRPYDIGDLTPLQSHLFNSPVALAIPTADGTFSERYAYVLNWDGSIAVGKYSLDENQALSGAIGWIPWSGAGTVSWLAAQDASVIFTTSYAPNGITPAIIVEALDDTLYLDGAMLANAVPAAFTPPGGKGPFWWIPGGSVDLMDHAYRPMGTYQIDADGFIVPQFNGGEDLTEVTLIGGQTWTATWEPFIPQAPPGQGAQQRMRRRRIVKANVNVQQSSGFIFGTRRVPAYFVGDNATVVPPLREGSFQFRPRGRDYDPRIQLVKDTPGPLIITEVGMEVTT